MSHNPWLIGFEERFNRESGGFGRMFHINDDGLVAIVFGIGPET